MKRGGRKGRERVLDVEEAIRSLAHCVCTVIQGAADDIYKNALFKAELILVLECGVRGLSEGS